MVSLERSKMGARFCLPEMADCPLHLCIGRLARVKVRSRLCISSLAYTLTSITLMFDTAISVYTQEP